MVCTSCGQRATQSSNSGSGCCDLNAMDEVTPLNKIQNGDEEFCFNEITDKICENLQNDEGIHPSATHSNTDCDDLSSLNDLATSKLHNALMVLDICNIDDYKCWLDSLLGWQWNIDKGIVCAICGLWSNIHKINDMVGQIQQSITVNGKIEIPRDVDVSNNPYLITPVDLGEVTENTRISITWQAGSTRRVDTYTVGDLKGDSCHIYGGNMSDTSNYDDAFELFTKIKQGTNSLWITTIHRRSIGPTGSITWPAAPFLDGHVYTDDQDPRYTDMSEANPYHVAEIKRVTVYDLVDPIEVN